MRALLYINRRGRYTIMTIPVEPWRIGYRTDNHTLAPKWIIRAQKLHLTIGGLTHWGRMTHICVGKLTIIGSDNGLSPGRHQAIIWTNAGMLLFGPVGSNFSENLIEIDTFSLKKMHLKPSSAKWRPFCLGLNVLIFTFLVKSNW